MAGAQVAATIVWLTSNSQLEGTIGRVADTAHTGSFITRRSHLNLLWIITSLTYQVKSIQYILYYILFSSKEQLLWFASCPMQDSNRSISRLIMENLKPTPQLVLRLGGYNDITRQNKDSGLKSGSRDIFLP